MIKNTIYIWTLLCLCLSCQHQPAQTLDYTHELTQIKQLVLPIDERTYYLSKSIFQFEENGTEYLHFLNTGKSLYDIIIFNLDEQTVETKIGLQKQGPNGVPTVNGSKPFMDSSQKFLLFQNNIGRITLIDSAGRVLRNYNVKTPDGRFTQLTLMSFFNSPSFIKDSILYTGQNVLKPNMKKREWSELPMLISVDLRNGACGWTTSLYHPNIFINDCENISTGNRFSYDYNYKDNRLVCSFDQYDSIMVSDDLKEATWYNAKSKYLKPMRPKLLESNAGIKGLVEYAEKPKYSHLIYDKYRDVYYRFAQMPYELQPDESPYDLKGAEEFSVIVLNNKFEIIGETRFPGGKYYYKMSFVGKDGLYISENNLCNLDFDENKLVFACFELKELK